MRLLLDTSIVVPIARLESESLTKTDRAAISDPSNALYVSVVALWEIAIKTRLGKLEMRILPRDLPAHLTGMGMQLLAIDVQHVLADLQNDVETRDPFDRLLVAQCEVEDLRLVTTDPALLKHPLAWRG